MNQSEFLAITCNLLQAREKSHVQDAISLGSHWLRTWRRCFQSITKRRNHMALGKGKQYREEINFIRKTAIAMQRQSSGNRCCLCTVKK